MDMDWLINECTDPEMLARLFYVERYAWLSLSPGMCAVISIDGQLMDINTHWEQCTSHSREELQDSYLIEHIHFDDRERALADMQKLITSDIGSTTFSFRFRCKDDTHKQLSWNVIFSPDHNAYFCTVHDPSSDHSISDKLAYRDVLTGLDNRLALEEALPETVESTIAAEGSGALMFIDLDGFKEVNDTHGHKAGDTLLVRAAKRMNSVIGNEGITYRLGGDEFIIVLPQCPDRTHVAGLAGQVVERLRSHYVINGQRVNTGASMGIAMFPADGKKTEDIMEKADMAMYQVKKAGKNNFIFYGKSCKK